jgi:2-iminobutanoate/2-iminopropanoate deaminase
MGKCKDILKVTKMKKAAIYTEAAPTPLGAYSQAIVAGDLVFTSGQLPIDPKTGNIVGDTIEGQTRQVLNNIGAILTKAGGSIDSTVKVTVFLKDLNDLQAMNKVYGEFFSPDSTARMVFQASRLPRDVKVIMDAVAYLK